MSTQRDSRRHRFIRDIDAGTTLSRLRTPMREDGMEFISRVRAALLCLFLASPTAFVMPQSPPNLIGTWHVQEAGLTVVLVFNADGTGKLDNTRITYTMRGNTLRVEEAGGTVNQYTFALQGNRLTLSGGDLTPTHDLRAPGKRSGDGSWGEARAGSSGASRSDSYSCTSRPGDV